VREVNPIQHDSFYSRDNYISYGQNFNIPDTLINPIINQGGYIEQECNNPVYPVESFPNSLLENNGSEQNPPTGPQFVAETLTPINVDFERSVFYTYRDMLKQALDTRYTDYVTRTDANRQQLDRMLVSVKLSCLDKLVRNSKSTSVQGNNGLSHANIGLSKQEKYFIKIFLDYNVLSSSHNTANLRFALFQNILGNAWQTQENLQVLNQQGSNQFYLKYLQRFGNAEQARVSEVNPIQHDPLYFRNKYISSGQNPPTGLQLVQERILPIHQEQITGMYAHLEKENKTATRAGYVDIYTQSIEVNQKLYAVPKSVKLSCLDQLVKNKILTSSSRRDPPLTWGLTQDEKDFIKIYLNKDSVEEIKNSDCIRVNLYQHIHNT